MLNRIDDLRKYFELSIRLIPKPNPDPTFSEKNGFCQNNSIWPDPDVKKNQNEVHRNVIFSTKTRKNGF